MKPLVTLILLTYNQEDFIEEAVKSVINQDYNNIEIIISDDCSNDQTFRKASDTVESATEQKKIILNKNDRNLGLTSHFNKILKMAKGEIIVIAAGDDISLPSRVTQSVNILSNHKDVAFVSFNDEVIDNEGNVLSSGERVKFNGLRKFDLHDYINEVKAPFSGASRAFRRELYDYFGNLMNDCPTEDTPYILRGLMLGKGAVSSDVMIQYRKHDNNLSRPSSLALMDIDAITDQYKADIRTAIYREKISESEASRILIWINKNQLKRKKLNQLKLSNSKLIYFLNNIIFESSISPLERIKLLKHIILKY